MTAIKHHFTSPEHQIGPAGQAKLWPDGSSPSPSASLPFCSRFRRRAITQPHASKRALAAPLPKALLWLPAERERDPGFPRLLLNPPPPAAPSEEHPPAPGMHDYAYNGLLFMTQLPLPHASHQPCRPTTHLHHAGEKQSRLLGASVKTFGGCSKSLV